MNSLSNAHKLGEVPLLRTEGLEVSFDGFKAIRGVDFNLHRCELRFLIGPRGSGKTTLLDVFSGKVKPSKGRVLLHDTFDLTKYPEHKIARLGMGRKNNAPSVFPGLSVLDNLLLSMKQNRGLFDVIRARTDPAQREQIMETMETVGLTDKESLLAGALTYGEKQWLEIGMLLMQEPEVLLLDQPTKGMTKEEMERTGKLLERISAAYSILVAEDNLAFVKWLGGTVTVLNEGTIGAEGTLDELLGSGALQEWTDLL